MNISTAYNYAKFDKIFGSTVRVMEMAAKFNNEGDVDNRRILFIGKNTDLNTVQLYMMVFHSPLVDIPPANVYTPPASVIGYSGFISQEKTINGQIYIKSAPDFIDRVIVSGFKLNSFSVFKIENNFFRMVHSLGFPKYYKEGDHLGTTTIDT